MEASRVVLVAGLLLVLPLTAVAPAAGSGSSGTLHTLSTSVTGDDTFSFTMEVPTGKDASGVNIFEGSHLTVKGNYGAGGPIDSDLTVVSNGAPTLARGTGLGFNEPRQEAGAFVAILRNGGSPCGETCFARMIGDSLKDPDDVRVESDTLGAGVDQDANNIGYESFEVVLGWPQQSRVETGDKSGKTHEVQFIVSIPGASSLEVNVHLHLNRALTTSWTSHDGGFMLTSEDFDSLADVDTMAAQAMVSAKADVLLNPGPSEFIYFQMSPAWFGTDVISEPPLFFGPRDSIAFTHNTAAFGYYGVEFPGGATSEGYGLALGNSNGPGVVKGGDAGTYRFFVNYEAGAGPTDMYVVGFVGEI